VGSLESSSGQVVESCSIRTTAANELLDDVHDRMPVILPQRPYQIWLTAPATEAQRLAELLVPFDVSVMRRYALGSPSTNLRTSCQRVRWKCLIRRRKHCCGISSAKQNAPRLSFKSTGRLLISPPPSAAQEEAYDLSGSWEMARECYAWHGQADCGQERLAMNVSVKYLFSDVSAIPSRCNQATPFPRVESNAEQPARRTNV
jgi:hypothetical protein